MKAPTSIILAAAVVVLAVGSPGLASHRVDGGALFASSASSGHALYGAFDPQPVRPCQTRSYSLSGYLMPGIVLKADACAFRPGDVNGTGTSDGLDVAFLLGYFRGGAAPDRRCGCAAVPGLLFPAADVNGNCEVTGLDVIYYVNFLKGGPTLSYCRQCPPGGAAVLPMLRPRGTARNAQ